MLVKKGFEPSDIIWVTAKYLTVAFILVVIIYNQDPILSYIQLFTPEISFRIYDLVKPVLILLAFLYSASLAGRILYGEMVEALTGGIQDIGFTLSFLLFIQPIDFLQILEPMALFLVWASIISALKNISRPVLVKMNEVADPSLEATQIILTGYLLLRSWNALRPDISDILGGIFPYSPWFLLDKLGILIIVTTGVLAIQSVIQLLEDYPNPYLSFIGRNLGEKNGGRIFALNLILLYSLVLRRRIPALIPNYAVFLPVAEWLLICLVFFSLYRRMRSHVENYMTARDDIGVWTKHIQGIEFKTDRDMEDMTRAIEKFIDEGEKRDIMVYLIFLLRDSGLGKKRIIHTLSELMGYQDQGPGLLAFTWQVEQLEERNRRMRKDVISNILKTLSVRGVIDEGWDLMEEEYVEVHN
jgi:hypothetical protein